MNAVNHGLAFGRHFGARRLAAHWLGVVVGRRLVWDKRRLAEELVSIVRMLWNRRKLVRCAACVNEQVALIVRLVKVHFGTFQWRANEAFVCLRFGAKLLVACFFSGDAKSLSLAQRQQN